MTRTDTPESIDPLIALFGEPIHVYTRAQAITDEVLRDISTTAREAGFLVPTAITSAAWTHAVAWDDTSRFLQDEDGRLWDVLRAAHLTIRLGAVTDPRVPFTVRRFPNRPGPRRLEAIDLIAHLGPGDAGEPVVTIMLPTED